MAKVLLKRQPLAGKARADWKAGVATVLNLIHDWSYLTARRGKVISITDALRNPARLTHLQVGALNRSPVVERVENLRLAPAGVMAIRKEEVAG